MAQSTTLSTLIEQLKGLEAAQKDQARLQEENAQLKIENRSLRSTLQAIQRLIPEGRPVATTRPSPRRGGPAGFSDSPDWFRSVARETYQGRLITYDEAVEGARFIEAARLAGRSECAAARELASKWGRGVDQVRGLFSTSAGKSSAHALRLLAREALAKEATQRATPAPSTIPPVPAGVQFI